MNSLSSFYRSASWLKIREIVYLERRGVCEVCGKELVNKYDYVCHHIKPLTFANCSDPSVSLNSDNLQCLCHSCHNSVHRRFGSFDRHISIVWGSPFSGKSDYIKSSASPQDFIVSFDAIRLAFSIGHDNSLVPSIMHMWRAGLDIVRTRAGRWCSAFVCRPLPLRHERERLADELDAELIHIDTSKAECLARAGDDPTARQLVCDFFDRLQV